MEIKHKITGEILLIKQTANLRGADLRGANLDFSSGIPFSCKGTKITGDDRLFAQILYHLTRQDWSSCSGEVKESLEQINKLAIVNLFCKYRNDLTTI